MQMLQEIKEMRSYKLLFMFICYVKPGNICGIETEEVKKPRKVGSKLVRKDARITELHTTI